MTGITIERPRFTVYKCALSEYTTVEVVIAADVLNPARLAGLVHLMINYSGLQYYLTTACSQIQSPACNGCRETLVNINQDINKPRHENTNVMHIR